MSRTSSPHTDVTADASQDSDPSPLVAGVAPAPEPAGVVHDEQLGAGQCRDGEQARSPDRPAAAWPGVAVLDDLVDPVVLLVEPEHRVGPTARRRRDVVHGPVRPDASWP